MNSEKKELKIKELRATKQVPEIVDYKVTMLIAAGAAMASGATIEAILEKRRAENPAGRFGDPEEFGAACAFLCSRYAGYITGQNLLMDGGAFPGML